MKKLLPTVLLATIFIFGVNSAYAQEAGTEDRVLVIGGTTDEAGSLSINFAGDPGETLKGSTSVTNLSTETLKIKTEFTDFIVESEAGVPTPVEAGSSIWAMSLWISVPAEYQEFTIEPNETKEVPFTIDAPQDATPGGHYAMVLFTPTIVKEEVVGPLIEHKVGNLVKLTISGDIKENAEITELSAPYFSEYGPIPLTLRVLNSGNTHVKTSGMITIRNMFDKEVAKWEVKPANVFPTAVRAWDTEWAGKWRFGLYKAEANLVYGSSDTPITSEVYFWVFPWKAISVISGIIVLFIVWGKYLDSKENKKSKKLKSAKKKNEETSSPV